ncbi:MAG: ubiquinone/menaquinone biosynthesis methyltransferase [Anaerolineae bacterium]|nr:ubiquinone/menaquinone biosynthesis methyltransferase [Anaerolineae bacterium]
MAQLQGRERAAYVRAMFGRIAGRYDITNRLMTFGRDRAWRRYVVRQAALPPGGRLLDVATGAGEIAFEALRLDDRLILAGVDFAAPMMQMGRQRRPGARVLWAQADALALPFPDGTFDAVTSGYLMRNVIDVAAAFREQARVAKPGGRVVCLDTSPPPDNLLKPFISFYLRYIIPLLGRAITGDASAYRYLPESTQAFKTPDELAAIMREVGLVAVRYRRFMFGTMAVHVGVKPL